MKLRNTTDFDSAVMRSLLRSVVREVEASLIAHHPMRHATAWSADDVRRRADFILKHCDIWVRQQRSAERRDFAAEAARYRELGKDELAARLDVVAEHGDSTGRANLSGRRLRMTLAGASLVDFLWLARHEAWHLFGVHHHSLAPTCVMRRFSASLRAVPPRGTKSAGWRLRATLRSTSSMIVSYSVSKREIVRTASPGTRRCSSRNVLTPPTTSVSEPDMEPERSSRMAM